MKLFTKVIRVLVAAGVAVSLAGGWLSQPGTAKAQTIETFISEDDFGIISCTSTGQLCDTLFTRSVETGGVLQAQYFVRSTHCSPVRIHFYVDGTLKHTSAFLGWRGGPEGMPLDTGLVDLGPVTAGLHTLGLQAEGQADGCNSGYLATWGGSLRIVTSPLPLPVALDIKPQSCPNPLNVKDKGVLSVAVLGTSAPAGGRGFDVSQIEPTTVKLMGVSPLRSAVEDVATPFGRTPVEPTDCTVAGPDGVADLTLKFDTQAVVAALGAVSDGEVRVLMLTGDLKGTTGHLGACFAGEDVVVIVKKK